MNQIIEGEKLPSREPKPRGRKPNRGNPEMLAATGGLPLPLAPTTADELAQIWEVPAGSAPMLSVKVMRQIIGAAGSELVAAVPLIHYDLRDIAGKYGPGLYYLRGGGGKIFNRVLKVTISDDFARENGFGRIPERPAPSAQDVVAVNTLQKTSQSSGVSAEELVAAMERVVERKANQIIEERMQHQSALTMPWQNPGDMLKAQMEAAERQMDFFAKIEERVRRSIVGEPIKPSEESELSVAGIIKMLAPAIPSIIQGFTQNRQQIQQQIPQNKIQNQGPAPVRIEKMESQSQIQTNEQVEIEPMNIEISTEDKQKIAPAIAMLKPHAGLLSLYSTDQRPISEIAIELCGYIPLPLYDATIRFSELAAEKGPEMMMYLGNQFRSERWVEIVKEIGAVLKDWKSDSELEGE